MPLIVNGLSYKSLDNSQAVENVKAAILALPEPNILDGITNPPSLAETAMYLQHEMVHIDTLNPTNTVRYLGTLGLVSCIAVYVHSDTDHFCIHIDNKHDFDFTKYISQFKNKTHIRVSLVGGVDSELSDKTLSAIILALLAATKSLGIDITIENQKLTRNNKFTEKFKPYEIFDWAVQKLSGVYEYYYHDILDPSIFASRHPLEFLHNTTTSPGNDIMAAAAIKGARLPDSLPDIKQEMLGQQLKLLFPKKDDFLNAMKKIFCRQFFSSADLYHSFHRLYPTSLVRNFVFDTQTGQIALISKNTATPYRSQRHFALLEPSTLQYRYAFDNKLNRHTEPSINPACLATIEATVPEVKNRSITKLMLAEKTRSNKDIYSIDLLTDMIVAAYCAPADPSPIKHIKWDFFKAKQAPQIEYESATLEHQNLSLLFNITGEIFTGKMRRYPEKVLDALFIADSDRMNLVKNRLNQQGVDSHLVSIGDDNILALCVPAINVRVGQHNKNYFAR